MIKAAKRHSTVDQAPQSPINNDTLQIEQQSKAGPEHPLKMASEDLGKISVPAPRQ